MKKFFLYFILCIFLVITLICFVPKPPLLNAISFSQAVYDEQNHLLRLTLSSDDKYRLFIPLQKISPLLIQATLLQEDQYYYLHPGINPFALLRATWQTYIIRSRQYGASTISMQVARMLFHINSKSISGKIMQIIRALQLELFYSKKQILEAYLNLASYGGNVEGAGAASLIYFGKPISQLTIPEALTLAVIPQNPPRRQPSEQSKIELQQARMRLFNRWLVNHPKDIDKKALLVLPMQITPHYLPFLAPHFTNKILRENPNKPMIKTSLNLKIQNIVAKIVKNYLIHQKQFGINNLAVMLVDSKTMSVKVLIGSGDFFEEAISGQIDGTQAKRSPGSALKPFIYALALDQGLIHPYTILKDAPTSFGAYNPENFDKDFIGPIRAQDALILSRNIPAIYLANQLYKPSLYQFLQKANVRDLKSESHYGLALVLGGGEVTMQELITLYGVLANNGIFMPLKFISNPVSLPGKRLLSKEASFLTLDMLQNTPRPNGFLLNKRIPVYWKTGTSSGYRDAWSVGIFGDYILAVWVGDFHNKSNPAYIGTQSAAPLFFNIIAAIAAQPNFKPNLRPISKNMNITKVNVCSASGLLTTRYCKRTEKTWFIPGVSPIKKDTVFREVAIDSRTGLRACDFNEHTKFVIYEFWPSDLLKIFAKAGIQRQIPPEFSPECSMSNEVDEGIPPKIISPQKDVIYSIKPGTNQDTVMNFSAITDGDVKKLFWFVNDNFVGVVNRDQFLFWHEKPGTYVVRVVDDHGRSDARDLVVTRVQG